MNWDETVKAWYTEIKGWKPLEGRDLELVRGALYGYANWSPTQVERAFEHEHHLLGTQWRPIVANPGTPSLESIFEEIKARNLSVTIARLKSKDWWISITRPQTDDEYGQEFRGWDAGELNEVLAEALILFVRKFK